MSNTNLSHLSWRAAIKTYEAGKKLPEEKVSLLVNAARLAPTSFGVQPFKLYVISDAKIKKQLRAAGYDQAQFTDASHIFVFAARTTVTKDDMEEYIERISEQRGASKKDLEGFKGVLVGSIDGKTKEQLHGWAAKQAYIALGMTLDVAAKNNIDTTPMEGFDAYGFDKILGLEKDVYHSVVVMAAGYRSDADKYSQMPKVRKTVEEFAVSI